MAPSEVPEGFARSVDDSRPPRQFILVEAAVKDRTVFPADPALKFQRLPTPVQDETIWAKLDPKYRNLCPANLHGMRSPGENCCDKEPVCNQVREQNKVHLQLFRKIDK